MEREGGEREKRGERGKAEGRRGERRTGKEKIGDRGGEGWEGKKNE